MSEHEPTKTVLFTSFFGKARTCGVSSVEIEEFGNCPIGHGSLSEFIRANISAGNFEWIGGKLYNTQRRNFLDLNEKALAVLRTRAMEAGLPEAEYAGKIVSEFLKK